MRRVGILLASLACVVPMVSGPVSATALTHPPAASISARKMAPVGTLSIPRLKVKSTIYIGVTDEQFNVGVGEWPGSPQPGTLGNIVIGGHRTSGHRPFANIHKLKTGDLIYLKKNGKTFRYVVARSLVVSKTAMWITKPTPTSTLTLFSCHPVGKTSHRYVIRATFSPE
jgi:sortase A